MRLPMALAERVDEIVRGLPRDWERARRQVQWSATENSVTLQGAQTLTEATVLVFQPENKTVRINGEEREPLAVSRWGIDFSATVLDLQAGEPYTIDLA